MVVVTGARAICAEPLGGDLPIKHRLRHIASVLLAASNRVCAAANFASPVQRCSL